MVNPHLHMGHGFQFATCKIFSQRSAASVELGLAGASALLGEFCDWGMELQLIVI